MPDIIPADSLCRFLHLPYLSLSRRATTMGRRAADFMQRWIAENVTADRYGPGAAEALAVKCRADAEEAGFDPDKSNIRRARIS
jgi:hypothetical protein